MHIEKLGLWEIVIDKMMNIADFKIKIIERLNNIVLKKWAEAIQANSWALRIMGFGSRF